MLCIAICAAAELSAQLPPLPGPGPLFLNGAGSDFAFSLPDLDRRAVLQAAVDQEKASEIHAREQAAQMHQAICSSRSPVLLGSQYSEAAKDQHRIALALNDQLHLFLLEAGKKTRPPLDEPHVRAYVALRKKSIESSQKSWLAFLSGYSRQSTCDGPESLHWKAPARAIYLALYLVLRPLEQTDRLLLLAQLKGQP